jgi:protein TonB
MKSILGISITLHVAVFSTAFGIGAQRRMLHVPATKRIVLEMHLGAAPRVPQATKYSAPEVRKRVETTAPPTAEIALPKLESQTTDIAPNLHFDDAAEAGKSCNCAPVQSASASTTARSNISGTPHGGGDTAPAEVAGKTDESPWIISSPAPEYPREARRKGWIGRVGVHVLISDKGTVQQAEVLSSSGYGELDDAALKALRRWIFHPAKKEGRAVTAWVVVPVLFRLDS